MTRLDEREFRHQIVVVTMDPDWTTPDAMATLPVVAGSNFRGYVRIGRGDRARYAFVGGRQHWVQDGLPAAAGLLFEVSPRMRLDPRSYPSDGRRFHEIGEVAVANDPALFEALRAGYSR